MKKIVLISKDAMSKNFLPVYYNRYWTTPNIDALAKKGTVFNRHYTVAASTAMAFYSMITAENCYQTKCRDYGDERPFSGDTIFDRFKNDGLNSYLVWDESFTSFAKKHLQILDGKVNVVSLNILPNIPPHVTGKFDDLTFNDNDSARALDQIYNTLSDLANKKEDAFIWMHLPHVLAGRNSYCSDIDLFDEVVGYARRLFGDESIFVTADHGNLDGKNGKFGYGFDLEETAICIPLITPRINNTDKINFTTSNIRLYDILNGNVEEENMIVSDTAYYCQPKRKIAIIDGAYKLVYCKQSNKFELYDLSWDPEEKYNLFYPEFYDKDRLSWFSLNQRFYYPNWENAMKEKDILLKKYNEIWRKGSCLVEKKNKIKFVLKYIYTSYKRKVLPSTFKNVGK